MNIVIESSEESVNYVKEKSIYDDKQSSYKSTVDTFLIEISLVNLKEFIYRRCNKVFYSNNKLHRYLRSCRVTSLKINKIITINSVTVLYIKLKKLFVIDSKVSKQTKQLEYDFRSYRYIILQILFNLQNSIKFNVCVDTKCDIFLIDRQFLKNILSDKEIYTMSIAIAIRDIDDRSHILSKYIDLNM